MSYSKCTAGGYVDCYHNCEECGFSKTESDRRKAKIRNGDLTDVVYIYENGTRLKLKTLLV